MKKIILGLGVIAIGLTAMQSCSKKKECVCTDKDGVTTPFDMSGSTTSALRKVACDAANLSWSADGGSCKLK